MAAIVIAAIFFAVPGLIQTVLSYDRIYFFYKLFLTLGNIMYRSPGIASHANSSPPPSNNADLSRLTQSQLGALKKWEQEAVAGEDRSRALRTIALTNLARGTTIDLSGLGLLEAPPHLPPGVTEVNLSHNRLAQFPAELPANLIFLSLCGNLIQDVSDAEVAPTVLMIDLSHNCLANDVGMHGVLICTGGMRPLHMRHPSDPAPHGYFEELAAGGPHWTEVVELYAEPAQSKNPVDGVLHWYSHGRSF
jgi:hypothetical protein